MKAYNQIERCINRISNVLAILSYVGYGAMILLTVADVLLRYLLNSPILGSAEIVQYMLLIAIFSSFALTQTEHGHIQVTMFLRLFPRRVMFLAYAFMELLSTAIWAFFAYAVARQARYAMQMGYVTSILKFSTPPFIWAVFVCLIIFTLTTFIGAVKSFLAIFDRMLQQELYEKWF